MKQQKFNDGQGNRDRMCRYGAFVPGQGFLPWSKCVAGKIAWQQVSFRKNGKWTNRDWLVTFSEGVEPLAFMRPFDGWPGTMEGLRNDIRKSVASYGFPEPSDEAIEAVFAYSGSQWTRIKAEKIGFALDPWESLGKVISELQEKEDFVRSIS